MQVPVSAGFRRSLRASAGSGLRWSGGNAGNAGNAGKAGNVNSEDKLTIFCAFLLFMRGFAILHKALKQYILKDL